MPLKLVNLTPDPVTIRAASFDGSNEPTTITLPSAGHAEVEETRAPAGWLYFDGVVVEVTSPSYGAVTGLPDPQDEILYIVSPAVIAALPSRKDLASPGPMTGRSGCRGLTMSPWEKAHPDWQKDDEF